MSYAEDIFTEASHEDTVWFFGEVNKRMAMKRGRTLGETPVKFAAGRSKRYDDFIEAWVSTVYYGPCLRSSA